MEGSKESYGDGTSVPEIEMKERSRSIGGEKLVFDIDLGIIEEFQKTSSLDTPEWK